MTNPETTTLTRELQAYRVGTKNLETIPAGTKYFVVYESANYTIIQVDDPTPYSNDFAQYAIKH